MSSIRLSDYIAQCLTEIVRAREMMDEYSVKVAGLYAKDELMRFLPAPRFTLKSVRLNMPMLITDLDLSRAARFSLSFSEFEASLLDVLRDVNPNLSVAVADRALADFPKRTMQEFYEVLISEQNLLESEKLVAVHWRKLMTVCLTTSAVQPKDIPEIQLKQAEAEVLRLVRDATVVDVEALNRIMVEPRTDQVKREASDSSVFTVTADVIEESMFIRSVQGEGSPGGHQVVEFE